VECRERELVSPKRVTVCQVLSCLPCLIGSSQQFRVIVCPCTEGETETLGRRTECLCSPQNSYVETLIPSVMVLGGQLWEVMGVMNRSSTHMKETPESSLPSYAK